MGWCTWVEDAKQEKTRELRSRSHHSAQPTHGASDATRRKSRRERSDRPGECSSLTGSSPESVMVSDKNSTSYNCAFLDQSGTESTGISRLALYGKPLRTAMSAAISYPLGATQTITVSVSSPTGIRIDAPKRFAKVKATAQLLCRPWRRHHHGHRSTGATGPMLINAQDGRGGDKITCNSTKTRVLADRGDILSGTCKRVKNRS